VAVSGGGVADVQASCDFICCSGMRTQTIWCGQGRCWEFRGPIRKL